MKGNIMKENKEKLAETIEKNGITYTLCGDYYLPDLVLPEQKEVHIGMWGQRYRNYLKNNHPVLYTNLLTSVQLYNHIAEVDKRAEAMYESLIKDTAEKEGVTEQLKSDDMMLCVQKMNNIKNRAREIVLDEIMR